MIQQLNHLIAGGRFHEALAMADAALLEHADFHLYHEKKAEILLLCGRKDDALRSLRAARELRPDLDYLSRRIDSMLPPTAAVQPAVEDPLPLPRRAFCGIHQFQPDLTGRRQADGGLRLKGIFKSDADKLPLVTIITAVFNNPDTLERCILSVLAQDYPNIEYLIIDGGSLPPTLDIIRSNMERIDYFVSEPDGGIYAAMNKGIRLARGSYICLLNSDDFYHPDFVSRTVNEALTHGCDLVSTDYHFGSTLYRASPLEAGTCFGQINLRHNTFLVSRRCYDLVGPHDETFRVISDTLWMHEAYKRRIRTRHIAEPLFTFSEGGLSSGSTPELRRLVVDEILRFYRADFPHLESADARAIYLVRFDPKRLPGVIEIARKRKWRYHRNFRAALGNYLERCFRDRNNFLLPEKGAKKEFLSFLDACAMLGIPLDAIRRTTSAGCFSVLAARVQATATRRKTGGATTILHFATVFSAPSETFIHDLLVRLENQTGYDNFMLFEQASLETERPYPKSIGLPWSSLEPEVREALYRHLFETLRPALVIGHFALNTWKLATRLKPLGIQIPMLSMTHGIDVFSLSKPGTYQDFIVNDLSKRPDARFTAVSNFLRRKLISHGVPADKIDIVHNTVHPRFHQHRGPRPPRTPGSALRLLTVGRLVEWKGHDLLFEALALVIPQAGVPITLTLLYANDTANLQRVQSRAETLGLTPYIEWIPFLDFGKEPDFHSRFDLLVHPSTYSSEETNNTETFGVSVLEAIAAGLPVITTDAGGLPQVVGTPNPHARIVPHGDAAALAEAILAALRDPETFTDNQAYAAARLDAFSENRQITALVKSIRRVLARPLDVAIFSTITTTGAGYAAYRLHRGLLESEVIRPALFTTSDRHQGQPGVTVVRHPSGKPWRWASNPGNSARKPHKTIFTVNVPILRHERLYEMVASADIICLQWTARFLSAENIAWLTRCGKPVVLTFRDMQPITGGCHYFHGCDAWMHDCSHCPQLTGDWDGFPSELLRHKRNAYDFSNLTLVALSHHSAAILRQAPYFRDCRIEVIPNSIETEIFRPCGKAHSREQLGLPQHRRIIAYAPSYSSEVKGFREALGAFRHLAATRPELEPVILLVGNEPPNLELFPFETHTLGYVEENEKLSLAYSAADVVIVPSLEETFSNTTAEAIACGTPVVGFRTGAIPDMIIEGKTGHCVEVGDVIGFAEAIARVLTYPNLETECRRYAEEHLRFNLQAQRYEDLLIELVAQHCPRIEASSRPLVAECFGGTTQPIIRYRLRESDKALSPALVLAPSTESSPDPAGSARPARRVPRASTGRTPDSPRCADTIGSPSLRSP